MLKPNISDFYPFLSVFDLQGRRRGAAVSFQRFFKFFDVIIDARLHHRSSGERNYGDFLDALLDLYGESKMTRQEIQSLLMVIFLTFNLYQSRNFFSEACHFEYHDS